MKFRSHQNGIGQVFFTADHHFCHQSVIGMCGRPFDNADEMDSAMIECWNAVVGKHDVVWHLGDFAHRADPERARKIFHKLNGQKHIVIGNHDRKHTQDLPWVSQQEMAHITVDETRLHLCHYGLRTWPGIWRGAIHLYGHSHGRLPGNSMSMDIGVDNVGYYPLNVDHIKARLALLPPIVFPEELGEGKVFEVPVP
jgi:calcineurin-like phosphoesterase family protein